MRVIVVGAGVAGLTAADAARCAGAEVTVLIRAASRARHDGGPMLELRAAGFAPRQRLSVDVDQEVLPMRACAHRGPVLEE